MKAAARALKERSCPGLRELLGIAADVRVGNVFESWPEILDEIEDVERTYLHRITKTAGNTVRRLCSPSGRVRHILTHVDDESYLTEMVIDLVRREILPDQLLARLTKREDWPLSRAEQRVETLCRELRQSSRLGTLVAQLLMEPTGGAIKVPKVARAKLDQRQLAESFALTD